jgi:hypothetical protein
VAKKAVKTRKLPAVRHAEGCPEDPERIEVYEATRPNGEVLAVARCVDCAAANVEAAGSSSTEGDA